MKFPGFHKLRSTYRKLKNAVLYNFHSAECIGIKRFRIVFLKVDVKTQSLEHHSRCPLNYVNFTLALEIIFNFCQGRGVLKDFDSIFVSLFSAADHILLMQGDFEHEYS